MKRNYIFSLLLIVGCLWTFKSFAANWAVTDTLINDGYYRIHTTWWTGETNGISNGTDSVMYIANAAAGDPNYANYNCLYVKSGRSVTNDDWGCIWHIWKAGMKNGHQTYHFKNCGTGTDTYYFPLQAVAGFSGMLIATGTEQDSVMFRIKDWGTTWYKGVHNDQTQKMTRQDTIVNKGKVFIVPCSNWCRFRLGGSNLVKLNAIDRNGVNEWYLEPVDMGTKKAQMELNELMTDIRGNNYSVGIDPGLVSSSTALENLDAVLDGAQTLFDNGATDEQYNDMIAKLKTAWAQVKASVVKIEDGGHYAVRSATSSRATRTNGRPCTTTGKRVTTSLPMALMWLRKVR